MPLVKIDVYKGVRSPAELQVLADTIHEALMHAFSAPLKDRFQVITQHEPGELIIQDNGLGFQRTNKLVLIQIFQQGRDVAAKQALYNSLAMLLGERCGLAGTDLMVSLSENKKEDWSFGDGKAQFLTNEL
ncbi:Tautomerase/MIF [Aureobasidium melanogenum CBS 110374]|uniref:Tautomerase/MIF n=1 Tax=Aureobasidium melanogenum (strain CBS 110374) TaxID=1043003 RepID=A0A074WLZ6_AURM1|nr:Tautomerase/MIF [Aureobasidium melanogenum CBS 110374]KEQ63471.1 Tautomerase/MIF [Aureobasidium melanogenum CBS 110374]